jgi:hypothetical protein
MTPLTPSIVFIHKGYNIQIRGEFSPVLSPEKRNPALRKQ